MRCKSPLLSPLGARRLLHAMVLTTKARRYRFLPQQRFSLGYQSHLFLIKRNNERFEGIDSDRGYGSSGKDGLAKKRATVLLAGVGYTNW